MRDAVLVLISNYQLTNLPNYQILSENQPIDIERIRILVIYRTTS